MLANQELPWQRSRRPERSRRQRRTSTCPQASDTVRVEGFLHDAVGEEGV